MSVTVSTIGPSSRMLPARTKSTPARTHSTMTPARQHAGLDRRPDAAGAVDGVDGAHVVAVAALHRAPASRSTPSEVPKRASSASWTASALPASSTSTQPRRISSVKYAAPPVWTTTGPATKTIAAARAPGVAHHRGDPPTLASTRRSDEISLAMKAKSPRSRSRNSGVTRMPSSAADDPIAGPNLAQLPAEARAVRRGRSRRPCAVARPRSTRRRRAPACAGWSSSRSRRRRSRRDRRCGAGHPARRRVAAELHQILDQPLQAAPSAPRPSARCARSRRWCGRLRSSALRTRRRARSPCRRSR